ncbi:MAG TPA: prephenate dehydrogenase [Candidatus Omnitrophota bacterium]|nr:prephenate dehydrogenase [Candidatus Omnitrophota bacterium]HRZ15066.1 prephenate dehydrogenase [Candidatus Omnitrophota bacterium]
MKPFDTIGIIGTGLIGGSLGLAIKRAGLARRVIGVSRHADSITRARRMKAIDNGSLNLSIMGDADLVILAAPVETIIRIADKLKAVLKPGCIVIDTGSTKEAIVRALSRTFPLFVGCHPIAGSEKRGIANARADLFKGALCIITPVRTTDRAALKKVKRFFETLGARTCTLTPVAHDTILASVSHMPHCLAFALINAVPAAWLAYAGSGLRDMTRIAASDSKVWEEILCTNKSAIVRAIGAMERQLRAFKLAIARADTKTLRRLLVQAQQKRQRLA